MAPRKRRKKSSQRADSTVYGHAAELRSKPSRSLATAFGQKLREKGHSGATNVVMKIALDPSKGDELNEQLKKNEKAKETGPKKMSLPEATAVLYSQRFTKRQYIFFQQNVNRFSEKKAIPSYDDVADYRKWHCRPQGIKATELDVTVSLKDLLEHTISRINYIESFYKALEDIPKSKKIIFYYKIGYDGSSHHVKVKQKSKDGLDQKECDGSVIAVYMVGYCSIRSFLKFLLHQKMSGVF